MNKNNNTTHKEFNKKQEEMSQFKKEHGRSKPKVLTESKLTTSILLEPNESSFTGLVDKSEEFIRICNEENIPLTKAAYCAYTGISLRMLNKYLNADINTVFSESDSEELLFHHKIQDLFLSLMMVIEADILTGSMIDSYNSNISKLILSNDFSYKEKQDLELTTKSALTIVDDIDDLEETNTENNTEDK